VDKTSEIGHSVPGGNILQILSLNIIENCAITEKWMRTSASFTQRHFECGKDTQSNKKRKI
jgi:hypothetical protein